MLTRYESAHSKVEENSAFDESYSHAGFGMFDSNDDNLCNIVDSYSSESYITDWCKESSSVKNGGTASTEQENFRLDKFSSSAGFGEVRGFDLLIEQLMMWRPL